MSVHLHVLLHGLWGMPSHFAEAARIFKKRVDNLDEEPVVRVDLLIIESNTDDGTYDGIDWGAERAVDEIDERIRQIEKDGMQVTRFSVTGYSLGGLFARYAIGILYHRGFFNTVTPVNFALIACPNIGVPRYPSLWSSLVFTIGSNLLGRTGKQFYGTDTWSDTGKPLLEVMADKDLIFYKALHVFPRIDVYVNAVHDVTVPYQTGAFEEIDPFVGHANDIILTYVKGYEPLIESYSLPPTKVRTPFSLSERVRSWKPLPFSGPVIEWKFPFNLLLFVLLPAIIPLVAVIIPLRFALWSHASSARVRRLENADSMSTRLATVFTRLDKSIEQAVEDVIDQVHLPNSANDTTSVATQKIADEMPSIPPPSGSPPLPSSPSLGLTPGQKAMIASLNALPNLCKHRAFIHPVRNSHAAILVRNPAYSDHAKGVGVLRHWTDNFVV